ncbi:hypothetical protein BH10ACI4_BH10ACI4_03230 [soil metagenome]
MNRPNSFESPDTRRMLSLICVVLLLALGGAKLSSFVTQRMLNADAKDVASTWASGLVHNADDIPAIIGGAAPSDKTMHLLKLASETGGIYRYKVWDGAGHLVFLSDRMGPPITPVTIAERHGAKVAASILSGATFAEAGSGKPPENPPYFAEAYIPVLVDGTVVGVFEAYVDETDDQAMYSRSLFLTECTIVLVVFLAGGIPGWMVYRKLRDHQSLLATALFLAEHDTLTGIANRKRLTDAAKAALAQSRRYRGHVAILLIDLDRFKEINDTFGHAAGDQVLKIFATRLKTNLRLEDTAARLGGDEFVVLQVGIAQPSGASFLVERLMRVLSEPYDIGGVSVMCAASIGIAVSPTDAEELDQLLSCADAALYKAKEEGRNTFCFFEEGMDMVFRERRQLEIDMRTALDAGSFRLAYQPLFSLNDGRLLGFEALLRWPEGVYPRSPAVFIPAAEESGIIIPLGAWVLETACKAAARWPKSLKIAVNLSPVQFRDGDIAGTVQKALTASGLEADSLELEVTESLWLQSSESILEQLALLRSMRVGIALDDFGTGYSSLTYLWRFPFDKVKIDQSFVREMQHDPKAVAIIATIVAMGKTLGLTILAEGVETAEEARALREAGCDEAQGYWFGRPLTLEMANDLVEAQSGKTELVTMKNIQG